MRVIATTGYAALRTDEAARLADGTALADTARTGAPHVLTEGPEWDARFPIGAALHRELGFHAIATVPLLSSDETIGALSVAYSSPRPFTIAPMPCSRTPKRRLRPL